MLVDTGASRSLIGPVDRMTMGISVAELAGDPVPVDGIGGVEDCAEETDAYLMFASDDGEHLFYYAVELLISKREVDDGGMIDPESSAHRLPSILGREIFHRWEMHYAPHDSSLTFTVLSDDLAL